MEFHIMTIYLLDYENAGGKQLNILESIKTTDSVIIFYSKSCDKVTLSFELLQKITQTNLEVFKVKSNTKQALDFQLCTYLGYLIAQDSNKHQKFVILSNDKGFQSICSFWKSKNISIQMISHEPSNKTNGINELLKKECPELLPKHKEIMTMVKQSKTPQAFNNSLMRILERNQLKKVYHLLKIYI